MVTSPYRSTSMELSPLGPSVPSTAEAMAITAAALANSAEVCSAGAEPAAPPEAGEAAAPVGSLALMATAAEDLALGG